MKNSIYSWIIWLTSALFFFYKYALEVSPSIMTEELMAAFSIGGLGLGHLASSYFYSYMIMQTPVGLLIDRFGPRRVTAITIIICSLGVLLFSQADTFSSALAARFLIGFGAAFSAVNIFRLSANWFSENRFALMVGLSMTIGMLGAVFGEEPLHLFFSMINWREGLYYLSIVGFILSLLFYLVVRDSPKGHDKTPIALQFKSGLIGIVKNPQNWIISLYSGLMFTPIAVFGGFWGVSFLQEAHLLSKELAARASSLVFIGFAIGSPLFGFLSNYMKRRKPLMHVGTLSTLALFLVLIAYPELPTSAIFSITLLIGFFTSAFLLSFSLITEYNAPSFTGTAIGLMNTFNALFVAISHPIIGAVLDIGSKEEVTTFSKGSYQIALGIIPLFCLIAALLLLRSKETYCKSLERSH